MPSVILEHAGDLACGRCGGEPAAPDRLLKTKHQKIEHFVKATHGEAVPLISAQDGLLNLRITETNVEAARTGQVVHLSA